MPTPLSDPELWMDYWTDMLGAQRVREPVGQSIYPTKILQRHAGLLLINKTSSEDNEM